MCKASSDWNSVGDRSARSTFISATLFPKLRRSRLTIEALFLLTMSGAMFASLQSLILGSGPIYFEVVTILLVVYAFGKAIGGS